MSISSEITSMGENLKKDYQAIANLGADLTNVDKNIENIAELLDGVYDNLPKTSYQEGTEITLSNTLKGKLDFEDGIVGYGDTSQNSYEGYNLLDINTASTTIEKATFTKLDTGYNVVTDNTVGPSYYGRLMVITSFVDSSKTYAFSCDVTCNEAHTIGQLLLGWVGASKMERPVVSANTKTHIFGTYSGITTTVFSIASFKPNATIKVENFQIYEGSTDKTYEPYTNGASPNPDYPQEIEVVRGKNLFDKDNANIINSYFLQTDTTISASGNTYRSIYIECKPNTIYTISKVLSARFCIGYTTTTPTVGVSVLGVIQNNTATSITITTGSNAKYLIAFIYHSSYDTLTPQQIYDTVQIEKGSTATSYLPYNTIEEVVSGKNLLNIANFQEHYTLNDDGVPIYNGSQTRLTNTTPIDVEGLEKVTLTFSSWTGGNQFIYSLLRADNTKISRVASNTSGTTITIGQAKYLYICFYDGATLSNITDAMLVEGDTGATYEPYITPTSYQLSLGDIELNAIGNYKDYIYKSEGNWYVKKNVEKLVLNGSESGWDKVSSSVAQNRYYNMNILTNPIQYDLRTMYCNYLIYGGVNTSSVSMEMNKFYSWNNSATNRLSFVIDVGDSLNNFKTWLSEKTPKIYYQLATPTDTQITDTTLIEQLEAIYNAHSNNGTTIITSNGDLPIIIKCRALKGE